jgi:hypothetical protein
MESNIEKMTPEQKQYWKVVYNFMLNYNKNLLESRNYNEKEQEYLNKAISNYENKLTLLE